MSVATPARWQNRIVRLADVPPDQLLANPLNWRIHPEEQQDLISGSLDRLGWIKPVLVQAGSDTMIDGHARVILALRAGEPTVPVAYVDVTDAERDEALALLDTIPTTAVRDDAQWELLTAQLADRFEADDPLAAFLASQAPSDPDEEPVVGLTDPDEIPDPPADPRTRLGDLYALGEHRLLCGDAREPDSYARLFGEREADLLLTDPPYGVEYVGKTADALTMIHDDAWPDKTRHTVATALRLAPLRRGAAFYLCSPAGRQETTFRLAVEDSGLSLHQALVWVKQVFVLGHSDYHYRHETILYGWRPGATRYFDTDRTQDTILLDDDVDVRKLSKAELRVIIEELQQREPTSVWREDRPHRSDLHPTMKPVNLFARALRRSTQPGDIVLDCFAGSGTALIACTQWHRVACAIELDPAYCDVIIDRWQAFTGQTADLLEQAP